MMPPSPPRSYQDYAAEYEGFDLPALFAEASTLPESGALNQLLAFQSRLLDILGDQDLTADQRVACIRLAISVRTTLESGLAGDPTRLALYRKARDVEYGHLLTHARYPDVIRLAMPDGWTPPAG